MPTRSGRPNKPCAPSTFAAGAVPVPPPVPPAPLVAPPFPPNRFLIAKKPPPNTRRSTTTMIIGMSGEPDALGLIEDRRWLQDGHIISAPSGTVINSALSAF